MKLRKVLLTGLIVSGSLFANTLSDTTALIGQINNTNISERYELMNQIKSNINSLNRSDKQEAFRQMNQVREDRRASYKASLSPEKLAVYEEKARLRQEAKARYRANGSANFNNKKSIRGNKVIGNKSTRKKLKGGYTRRGPITQKRLDAIKATLSPEQLVQFADKIERQQNDINNRK